MAISLRAKLAGVMLSFVVYSQIALALPMQTHATLGVSEKSAPNHFLRRIAVYGHDKRMLLSVGASRLHMSKEEVERIRGTTGYIRCPGSTYKNGVWGSAALIGDGSHIITAGHMLRDPTTMSFREPLAACYFQTQGIHPQKVGLAVDDESQSGVTIGTWFPKDEGDFAVAKLKQVIIGPRPFPVDLSNKSLQEHEKTLAISAISDGVINPGLKQPIIQECAVESVSFVVTTILGNSCDLMHGASGSIHLRRISDGTLVIKGMAVGGDDRHPVEEYDESKGQFSKSIGVDGDFLGMILAADPSIENGQGGVE